MKKKRKKKRGFGVSHPLNILSRATILILYDILNVINSTLYALNYFLILISNSGIKKSILIVT